MAEEDNLARFRITVEDALANGITAMHDAGFLPDTLEFYEKLVQKGEVLPVSLDFRSLSSICYTY